ncbi:unnamed protein product [Bursaphelenchus xylophilus]|uniref:(pine wood nematode) hypothetical protein n=1 Tax=Bursaphelenchus xylophilus TaxID=6326 RepID=A0A1I7SVS7_BURXY|nr:unnamed protein product [Bursaphelenchus xylophilus]CAG9098198.1 unnamed protein product [Bursaphelenchus xylophilus]
MALDLTGEDPRMSSDVVPSSRKDEEEQKYELRYEKEFDSISNLFELKCLDSKQEVRRYNFTVCNKNGDDLMKQICQGLSSAERTDLIRSLFNEYVRSSGTLFGKCGRDFIVYNNEESFYTLNPLNMTGDDEVDIPASSLTSKLFQNDKDGVICNSRFVQTIDSKVDQREYLKFLNVLVLQNFWDTCDSNMLIKGNEVLFLQSEPSKNPNIFSCLSGFRSDVIPIDEGRFFLRLSPLIQYFLVEDTVFGIVAAISKHDDFDDKFLEWFRDHRGFLNNIFEDKNAINFITEERIIIKEICRKSAEEVMHDETDSVYDFYKSEGVVVEKRLPVIRDCNGNYHPMDFVQLAPFQTYNKQLDHFVNVKRRERTELIIFDQVVEKTILFKKRVLSEIGYLTKYKFKITQRLPRKVGIMLFPTIKMATEIIHVDRNDLQFQIKSEKIEFIKKGYKPDFKWALVNLDGGFDEKQIKILSSFLFFNNKSAIPPRILNYQVTGQPCALVDRIFEDVKNYDFVMYSDGRQKQLNQTMGYYECLKGIPVLAVDPKLVIKRPEAHRKWKVPMKFIVNTKLGGVNFNLHYPKTETSVESMANHNEIFDFKINRMFIGIDVRTVDANLHVISLAYTINNIFQLKGTYCYEDFRTSSCFHFLLKKAINEYQGTKHEGEDQAPHEVVITVIEELKDRVSEILKDIVDSKFTLISVVLGSNYNFLKYKTSAVEKGTVFENLPQGCFIQMPENPAEPKFFLRTAIAANKREEGRMLPWDEYTIVRSDVEVDLRVMGYMMFHFCALDPTELKMIRVPFFLKAAQRYALKGYNNYKCARYLISNGIISSNRNPFDQDLDPSTRSMNLTYLLKPRLDTYFCCDTKKE